MAKSRGFVVFTVREKRLMEVDMQLLPQTLSVLLCPLTELD